MVTSEWDIWVSMYNDRKQTDTLQLEEGKPLLMVHSKVRIQSTGCSKCLFPRWDCPGRDSAEQSMNPAGGRGSCSVSTQAFSLFLRIHTPTLRQLFTE